MFQQLLYFVTRFGERRTLHQAQAMVKRITERTVELRSRPDSDLQSLAASLKQRGLAGEALTNLREDLFALVCEAARRTIGLEPYSTQITAGSVLADGKVAEMKTGEGKTLAAVLPAALLALAGKGVHVVTVNDYLARRDAQWMGPVYDFLGISVGLVIEADDPGKQLDRKRAAYHSDVTYVTNSELVFDYLRDAIASSPDEIVGRQLHFAIIDEVDFLLLDEAKTPLIISDSGHDDVQCCRQAAVVVRQLKEDQDYVVDHKNRQVLLHDSGYEKIESAVGLSIFGDPQQVAWQHAFHNALLAQAVYERDVDYIVRERRVELVDEFTGRLTPDKRLAEGLHQALEAKEKVPVQSEDITLARISYQNYFRLYPRLAGMSGTAWSEREELGRIYRLGVISIPTYRPMIRKDYREVIYRSSDDKYAAVAAEARRLLEKGRPVLIGTASVKNSERLSQELKRGGIVHQVLNAKNHKAEAALVAQAGRPAAVTVATNMAGRGTDILLGGNAADLIKQKTRGGNKLSREEQEMIRTKCELDRRQVVAAGGLAVLGTEFHDAQRIDLQLAGRAGRQGDPGSSQFFVSLDDSVFRKFGGTALRRTKERYAEHPAGAEITDERVRALLQSLRHKVEVEDRAARLEVFRYDLIVEAQFRDISKWRKHLLQSDLEQVPGQIEELLDDFLSDVSKQVLQQQLSGTEQAAAVMEALLRPVLGAAWAVSGGDISGELKKAGAALKRRLDESAQSCGSSSFYQAAQQIMLAQIDYWWTSHLNQLELLEEAIGMRSYGEQNPLTEFQREASLLFQNIPFKVRAGTLTALLHCHY